MVLKMNGTKTTTDDREQWISGAGKFLRAAEESQTMREKRVAAKNGKRPSLGQNPLFRALHSGGRDARKVDQQRGRDEYDDRETQRGRAPRNELLQRLDGGSRFAKMTFSKGARLHTEAPPKQNALAAALGMGGRGGRKAGAAGQKGKKKVDGGGAVKPLPRGPRGAAPGGRTGSAGNGEVRGATFTGKKAHDITFRNASLLPFLRIENLTEDASESDITMVLTEQLGTVLKVLNMRTTHNKVPSVTVEAFFLHEDQLQSYVAALNGVTADGRVLKVTIGYHSTIINSDQLWNGVLEEVRLLRQQAMRRGQRPQKPQSLGVRGT